MCVCVCWGGEDTQRCIKHTHPFTVMISSYYQRLQLVASQTELFCSESTRRQLTNDCLFPLSRALNSLCLISFPTFSFMPLIDWLLCFQLEHFSTLLPFFQQHPMFFFFLFFSKAATKSNYFPFYACVEVTGQDRASSSLIQY